MHSRGWSALLWVLERSCRTQHLPSLQASIDLVAKSTNLLNACLQQHPAMSNSPWFEHLAPFAYSVGGTGPWSMLVIVTLILQPNLLVYGQCLSCGCENLQHSAQSPVLCSTHLSQSWTCRRPLSIHAVHCSLASRRMRQQALCRGGPYVCAAVRGMMKTGCLPPSAMPCCIWYSRACTHCITCLKALHVYLQWSCKHLPA